MIKCLHIAKKKVPPYCRFRAGENNFVLLALLSYFGNNQTSNNGMLSGQVVNFAKSMMQACNDAVRKKDKLADAIDVKFTKQMVFHDKRKNMMMHWTIYSTTLMSIRC
jgi:hypothetical protein